MLGHGTVDSGTCVAKIGPPRSALDGESLLSSNAKLNFEANKADIDRLWNIHTEVAGAGPGRKYDVEVLNRSAIVFITSCWEAYVEDVAMEAFNYLLSNATSATQIPSKVKALAVADMVSASDKEVRVWDLADKGWHTVLQSHQTTARSKWVDSLNTPKKRQVNELFRDLLGLKSLSGSWSWKGISATSAAKKLDSFITLRGQIAHRLKHDEAVYKSWGTTYLDHVEKLVEKTDDAVRNHIEDLVGTSPW